LTNDLEFENIDHLSLAKGKQVNQSKKGGISERSLKRIYQAKLILGGKIK
jgi:hypothetical protein